MELKLLNKQVDLTTQVVFTIEDESGAFYYKEWRNDKDKVIDSVLMDKDGHQIEDPVLMEKVEIYLESIGE